ncbi:hypothetical protein D3C77_678780 [compost metagenome]
MDDIEEKMRAGQPLLDEAMRAWRSYEEAKGVSSAEEIEGLRVAAEALIGAVSDYQQRVLGGPEPVLQ